MTDYESLKKITDLIETAPNTDVHVFACYECNKIIISDADFNGMYDYTPLKCSMCKCTFCAHHMHAYENYSDDSIYAWVCKSCDQIISTCKNCEHPVLQSPYICEKHNSITDDHCSKCHAKENCINCAVNKIYPNCVICRHPTCSHCNYKCNLCSQNVCEKCINRSHIVPICVNCVYFCGYCFDHYCALCAISHENTVYCRCKIEYIKNIWNGHTPQIIIEDIAELLNPFL